MASGLNLGVATSPQQLDADLGEILEIYRKSLDKGVRDEASVMSKGLFYMEQQLEDFIISNWDSTSLGQEYDLIYEDGALISQQYSTPVGRMDILATDRKTGSYVVIELKRNQTSDDTIGQVTRYMGWVKQELGDDEVKGVIIAGSYDQRLDYARVMMPELEVFIYEVHFNLKEYS
jgi:restriction system protein